MGAAEFEEKEYEGPLYQELLFGSHDLWIPGQVFEGHFGVDAVLNATHPLFWAEFGFPEVPAGVQIGHLRHGRLWRRHGSTRAMPNFSSNLLVQAKRPDLMRRASGAMAADGYSAPYWRFKVDASQRGLLRALDYKLGHRAFVVYAGAAFDTLADLFKFTHEHSVVEHSSFVRVRRMANHSSWNYFGPGTCGVAASSTERIEEPELAVLFDEFLRNAHDQLADAQKELHLLDTAIDEALSESHFDSARSHYVQSHRDGVSRSVGKKRVDSPSALFARVAVSFAAMGLVWLVAGAGEDDGYGKADVEPVLPADSRAS